MKAASLAFRLIYISNTLFRCCLKEKKQKTQQDKNNRYELITKHSS